MLPKMGNTLPDDDGRQIDRLTYQMEIAAALRRELGGSHRAIKAVMKWTEVSESAAKNWIAGHHGPSGEHLINLLRHSDEVVSSVLILSGRSELNATVGLFETRERLLVVLHQIDRMLDIDNAILEKATASK